MKKISVTHLETFRRFRDGATEWDTEQKVIDAISGEFKGNDYTNIGSAFHSIIENFGTKNEHGPESILKTFGVVLSQKQAEIAMDHACDLQTFVPEVKLTKKYETKIGTIILTGVADVLKGNTIRDTKCKFSPPKLTEYYDSCQWKFYLSIFGLEWFYYDIFEFVGYKREMGRNVADLELIKHEPFGCFAYVGMESDLQTLVDDFIEWITFRNLLHHLKDV